MREQSRQAANRISASSRALSDPRSRRYCVVHSSNRSTVHVESVDISAGYRDCQARCSCRSSRGSGKWTSSSRTVRSSNVAPKRSRRYSQALLDHDFRGTGSGRQQHGLDTGQPFVANLRRPVDQVGRSLMFSRRVRRAAGYWNCFGCRRPARGRRPESTGGLLPAGSVSRNRYLPWAAPECAGNFSRNRAMMRFASSTDSVVCVR